MSYSQTIGPGPVRAVHAKFLSDAEITRKNLVSNGAPEAELASLKKQVEDIDAALANAANDQYARGIIYGSAAWSAEMVSVNRGDDLAIASERYARQAKWIVDPEPADA